MTTNTKKVISASIAVSGLAAGAMIGLTLAIRLKYGVDAPMEDFMPHWLAWHVAYPINSILDLLQHFLGNLGCLLRLILTGDYTGYGGPLFGLAEDHWIWEPFYWLHQVVFKGFFNPYY